MNTTHTPGETARRAYELADARFQRANVQWAEAYANNQVWPSAEHAQAAEQLECRMHKAQHAAARAWDFYINAL